MLLRVRGPAGQTSLNLDPDATVAVFKALLEEKMGVPAGLQEAAAVRAGFPPRPLAFPSGGGAAKVSSLGLQAGDSLTIARLPGAAPAGAAAAAPQPACASPGGPATGAARVASTAAAAGTSAAAGSSRGSASSCCSYCFEPLSPFQRYFCLACCPGGAGAPWHACHACAVQRSASGGQPTASKRQRRDGDSREPCFEPGHPFAPVYHHGWLSLPPGGPAEGRPAALNRFLHDYEPWAADVPQDLSWISVSSGRPARIGSSGALGSYEERCARAEQEWACKPAVQRTAAAAQQIGKDCGITSGKWMVRTTPEDEALVWSPVAKGVYVEGLCSSAKISAGPQGGRPHQQAGQRVICVYTDDFGDKEDAMRVHAGLRTALRAALPQRAKWSTITYQPDIYTTLNLYYGNPDGIKPTIYQKKL